MTAPGILTPSADGKVSPYVRRAPSGVKAGTRSAFGLPSGPEALGGSCPGATGNARDLEALAAWQRLDAEHGATEAARLAAAAYRGARYAVAMVGDHDAATLGQIRGVAATLAAVPMLAAEARTGAAMDCRACYAARVTAYRRESGAMLARNLEAYREALAAGTLADAFRAMLAEHDAGNARRGLPRVTFRDRWSGDYLGAADAAAVARAVRDHARASAWHPGEAPILYAYTRTLEALAPFAREIRRGTVVLWASADIHNAHRVRAALAVRPGIRVAPLARHEATATALGAYVRPGARVLPCPENAGRLPLAVAVGRTPLADAPAGTVGRGACQACRACPLGTRDAVGFFARPGAPG